ncbi:MAG: hypothetical protein A2Y62_16915 [Candidatus Fischerbacteria bacterium RBG_13_37_8]|uniref:Sulfatase N-terminal domain-containing protein n=1 Tax=Candidatus Fischerbacteria bacterium RBG_13_37_8 TaxID=1817863 RepID=A0A1F5VF89_9BACT|nr:MAG: hypothetical protein A2Y62_16915 [Candidatus Fischerbacteria bacterium RBG_13_37_8]
MPKIDFPINFKCVFYFILILLSVGIFNINLGTAKDPKLNLLIVTLDTTRADHLGCYGYDKPISRNIDSLAEESVVFDVAISESSITPVSHASIFTGKSPYHHGLRVLHGLIANRLENKQTTLAELWRESGGQTSAFVSAYPVTAAFGLDQGFEFFDADFQQIAGQELISKDGIVNTAISQRGAKETTETAIKWLQNKDNSRKPFFMWVHYFDPHDDMLQPPEHEMQKLLSSLYPTVPQNRAEMLRAIYDCEIYYMDTYLGLLLDKFKEQHLWDNTMIIVVADHGEGLGDHNWWSHGILYQEQIRVPLLIHLPSMKKGKRIKSLVRTIDIMPTILEIMKIQPEKWPDMDGLSIADALLAGKTIESREAYSESVNCLKYGRPDTSEQSDMKNDKLYSLIDNGKKFIYHQVYPYKSELYDIVKDPYELNNLIDQQQDLAGNFLLRLKKMKALSEIMPGMTITDMERLEKLKSLGYVK